ncbi:MAG: ABC transporter permease [Planctomycetes bacterium]|nr:ABC transporter permease [Planctomycetota bacterium]
MHRKFYAIVRNTFIETIRQPIFSVLMWVAVAMLIVNPSLAQWSLQAGQDNKILQDVGLATLLLFGLVASAFSATGVITREIENRTVLTVISKPVGRLSFLLAKYVGVSGALLVGYYFLCLVLMMTVRHGVMETVSDKFDLPVMVFSGAALAISLVVATFGNYMYGWHFPTALIAWVVPLGSVALGLTLFFDPKWVTQSPLTDFGDMQMIYAITTTFLSVLVLTAFAVTISTRFSQVMTLIFCVAVFCIGLLADHLVGPELVDGRYLEQSLVHAALYAALPNFQFFWLADALTQEQEIPGSHVLRLMGYTALYIPAVLAMGVAMFQTREVG